MMEEPQNDADWRINKSVLQRNAYLFENSLWTDCTFKVKYDEEAQQLFKCHKNILASASCVFETMLFGLLKETDVITVTDIAPKTFEMMLRYIYCEELPNMYFQDFLSLGMAANKYMMMDLLKKCQNEMQRTLLADNAVPALEFAKITLCDHLINRAMEIMKTDTRIVLSSESFLRAEPDTINALLEENELNLASEKILWDAILKYAENQCSMKGLEATDEQLRQVLQPSLPRFRFLTMSSREFAEGPASSNILTNEECKAILVHIASPGISIKFPTGFSCSRKNRCLPIFKYIEEKKSSNSVEITFSLMKTLKISGLRYGPDLFEGEAICPLKVEIMKVNGLVNDTFGPCYKKENIYATKCVIQEVELKDKTGFDVLIDSTNFQANDRVKIVLSFIRNALNFNFSSNPPTFFSLTPSPSGHMALRDTGRISNNNIVTPLCESPSHHYQSGSSPLCPLVPPAKCLFSGVKKLAIYWLPDTKCCLAILS